MQPLDKKFLREMIWLDPCGCCLSAAADGEMNGIYTSMFFAEMNVVPTSGGQQSCRLFHFAGLDASSLWCSTERTLSGLFVSPAALQFL